MRPAQLLLCLPLLVCFGCRVRGVDQKSDAELATYTAAKASELPAGAEKSEPLLIGTKEAHELVPVMLSWEVAKDASGCLRIKKASLIRTGGPTSTEVYDVKITPPKDETCATLLDGDDRFESVQVSYCWRWNGAANTANCAYSGGVKLSANKLGVEGKDRANPAASSIAR